MGNTVMPNIKCTRKHSLLTVNLRTVKDLRLLRVKRGLHMEKLSISLLLLFTPPSLRQLT